MNTRERDLLVLVKDEFANEKFIEQELELLNEMLFHYETIDKFCTVHEMFDFNSYKILESKKLKQFLLKRKDLKPFQFICNKN